MLLGHIPVESEQFGTPAMPFALHRAVLVVVITVLKMPLRVSLAAGHGPNRQHSMTVELFEIRTQESVITKTLGVITQTD